MQFEIFVESKVAVKHRDHAHLGLTDVALLELCKTGATLLTDDLKLYLSATKSGFKAINYNHIRGTRFDFK